MKRICFLHSKSQRSIRLFEELVEIYGNEDVETADLIFSIGGDGFLLTTMQRYHYLKKPFYGYNAGKIGFLLNRGSVKDLIENLDDTEKLTFYPLKIKSWDFESQVSTNFAFNEISICRNRPQAARLQIFVNDILRMKDLVADGILVSTVLGSTAYNAAAGGPVLPIDSNLISLTTICPFRPRRWNGALLSIYDRITVNVLESNKRTVNFILDNREYRRFNSVEIETDRENPINLLFNKSDSLKERNMQERFMEE